MATIVRGEMRCFACARYLGDYESRTTGRAAPTVRMLRPEVGELAQHAVPGDAGWACSRCGGRVIFEQQELVAA